MAPAGIAELKESSVSALMPTSLCFENNDEFLIY